MPLSELTDPTAVEKALSEFDKSGRENFLAKYGFSKARDYFIVRNRKLYDSKAIAGAAHGFQHPSLGPMRPSEFSGGERTVATRLRKLGFTVSDTPQTIRPQRIWAFCANPNRYDIHHAVRDPREDSWSTDGRDIRRGDVAIIWQTNDHKKQRGIVAFADITGDPVLRKDLENPYWRQEGEGGDIQSRVPVQYSVPETLPLWVDLTPKGRAIGSLSVAKAQGGTVFYVTPDQWAVIREASGWTQSPTEEHEVEAIARPRSGSGQGIGLTHAERIAVEMRAMDVVRRCLQSEWDEIVDVSRSKSYDFYCKRGAESLRVEVKGTITLGDSVFLTYRELDEANKPGYALFVVSEISLNSTHPSTPKATGGRCRRIFPWQSGAHLLKAITYTCNLDWSKGVDIPFADPSD